MEALIKCLLHNENLIYDPVLNVWKHSSGSFLYVHYRTLQYHWFGERKRCLSRKFNQDQNKAVLRALGFVEIPGSIALKHESIPYLHIVPSWGRIFRTTTYDGYNYKEIINLINNSKKSGKLDNSK